MGDYRREMDPDRCRECARLRAELDATERERNMWALAGHNAIKELKAKLDAAEGKLDLAYAQIFDLRRGLSGDDTAAHGVPIKGADDGA